jgi:hypothetical protein
MYKQIKFSSTQIDGSCIFRIADGASIPFDANNTDYQNFKKDVNEGAELQDAEGNVLPSEEAKEFIKTLP